MKSILYKCFVFLVSLSMLSCDKEMHAPYDNPFFYIHVNQASSINVQSTRNETVDYKIYFSTKMQYEPITLNYEIVVGNGLQEGADFEVLSNKNSIVFKPGFFEMPVTIKWKSNPIDVTKDNSLTIKLLSNDKKIGVGLPGPDKNQSQLKIIKI